MNNSVTSTLRVAWASLRILLVLTVVCGVIYPLVVTGIAQGLFHGKANGSEVKVDGTVVGSELIGQSWNFKGTKTPDPTWFQGRPSNSGYDPLATGSSQLGANDPTLVKSVTAAKKQVAEFNGVPESEVPKDAVTGSASAIDPGISPAYAEIQVKRVAERNRLTVAQVEKLVQDNTTGRTVGFLGEPSVNVLELNIAVKELATQ
ncbi:MULTISPECIES: potassium-transporting ATPase subunit KdpC [Streptomyces]|uniref:Potassium-transporting ATPase KdpC subunit n=2 Tax=Streptomyces TaxID=1883 RepID=A0A2N8PPQ2_STRNR|nr:MULTISPECIES: potassium-transporting ATPase subunit KdpC [Streptomyces]PNE43008.1 potassium-transporting ATPase subunit C [Streptomyces noursei]SHM94414.1 K+-transporting ATPase ATPase C chain [Streptomyces yunnanensis]